MVPMTDPVRTTRGKLLWKRPEPSKRMARPILLRIPLRTLLLMGMLFLGMILPWWIDSEDMSVILIPFCYLGMFFGWLFVWHMNKPPMEVVEVYWNGVVAADWTGTRRFIPWGLFTSWMVKATGAMRKDGNWDRILELDYLDETVQIKDDVPGFTSLAKEVKSKINRPDRVFIDEKMAKDRRRRFRVKIAVFVVLSFSVITSLLVIVYLRWTIYWRFDQALFLTAAYVWGAMMLIPFFCMWLLDRITIVRYGLKKRRMFIYSVISVVFLYVAFGVLFYLLATGSGATDYVNVDADAPDYSRLAPGEYIGEDLRLSGPIIVKEGETLRIVDSVLTFDPAPGMNYGIWVGKGGGLELVNTTVTSSNPAKGYRVQIIGNARILDSIIEGTCEDQEEWDKDRRLRRNDLPFLVASDDVLIANTTFIDPLGTALTLRNSNATVEGCTFIGTEDDGIFVLWGAPTIVNCSFKDCYRSVDAVKTEAMLIGLDVTECRYGIYIEGGHTSVLDCHFSTINYTAISLDSAKAVIEGNTFVDVGTEVKNVEYSSAAVFWMMFILYYTFPIMILWGVWDQVKKGKKGRSIFSRRGKYEFLVDEDGKPFQ
jgi:hypothetical protein